MTYTRNPRIAFGNYLAVGSESPADVRKILDKHTEALHDLRKRAAKNERLRKIATAATVAGAVFAAIRLTDIWLAVRQRRRTV